MSKAKKNARNQAASDEENRGLSPDSVSIRAGNETITPKGLNQTSYIKALQCDDYKYILGKGSAGSGKTYLAVASSCERLNDGIIDRIIITRPAQEAGEQLGFLPGDLEQKLNPYMRPIFDALYEFFGVEKVKKLIEENIIEIAPIGFMRGRSLKMADIIVDEAQNTTSEQMYMLLTRVDIGSRMVICGDESQIDIPNKNDSGILYLNDIWKGIEDVSFRVSFEAKDSARDECVKKVINAHNVYLKERKDK